MEVFKKLRQAFLDQLPVHILTLVEWQADEGCLGQVAVVGVNGEITGQIIDSKCTKIVSQFTVNSTIQAPQLFSFSYEGKQGKLFWEYSRKQRKAVIFGAGHVSRPLCELLTKLQYSVTVFDDRPDFANRMKFPEADRVICNSFTHVPDELTIDSETAVIIVTRGHQYDIQCLRAVIQLECGYLGMIGSRRRVAAVKQMLLKEGIEKGKLAKLFAPIGLDIGAETPEEIAISIVAEVMAIRNCRSARSLAFADGRKKG